MIYTCTMNPAIDIFVGTEKFLPHIVNRSNEQDIQPNGKAVNISFILKMLDIDSVALGFSAGFTGEFIEQELSKKGIKPDFVHIDGITRLNVFTRVYSQKEEYKLVNPGPPVTKNDVSCLLSKISNLKKDDILCVSGSNPMGVPDDINLQIAQMSAKQGFKFVLDASTHVLETLSYKPYLIKPNIEELADWYNKPSLTIDEAKLYGKQMANDGACHVLISLGDQGALYINKDITLYANAPKGKVVNTACAGDTMIASFLAGLINSKSYEESLKFSVAAGSSTAFRAGLTDYTDVDDLMKQINIKKET